MSRNNSNRKNTKAKVKQLEGMEDEPLTGSQNTNSSLELEMLKAEQKGDRQNKIFTIAKLSMRYLVFLVILFLSASALFQKLNLDDDVLETCISLISSVVMSVVGYLFGNHASGKSIQF